MSCCSTDGNACSSDESASPQALGLSTAYQVKGMTCGHCKEAVTAALAALDGVTGVEVDVTAGLATVTSGLPLTDDAVREAVDEAGYELVGRA